MYSRNTGSVNQFAGYFRFDGFSRSRYFFDASGYIVPSLHYKILSENQIYKLSILFRLGDGRLVGK